MDWKKTLVKIAVSAGIAAATMIVGSLLAGLQNFHPDPGIQTVIWQAAGATIIGLVTGLLNWLKHKNDTIKN